MFGSRDEFCGRHLSFIGGCGCGDGVRGDKKDAQPRSLRCLCRSGWGSCSSENLNEVVLRPSWSNGEKL